MQERLLSYFPAQADGAESLTHTEPLLVGLRAAAVPVGGLCFRVVTSVLFQLVCSSLRASPIPVLCPGEQQRGLFWQRFS